MDEDDLTPEAGIDTEDHIFSIGPEVLRDLADEIENGKPAYLVLVDDITGEVTRYEVGDFDLGEWLDQQ